MQEYRNLFIGSLHEAVEHARLAIVGAAFGAALVTAMLFYLAVAAPTIT